MYACIGSGKNDGVSWRCGLRLVLKLEIENGTSLPALPVREALGQSLWVPHTL